MVKILNKELCSLIESLEVVSDRMCICENSEKKCFDFDKFPPMCLDECRIGQNQPATVDAIVLNEKNNHTIFVEFKDLKEVRYPDKWLTKEKLQQIYLKFHESFHMLSVYLHKKNLASFDEFYLSKKSIVVVYNTKKSANNKFHNHFKGKLNRFKYLVENQMVISCDTFIKFINKENLC